MRSFLANMNTRLLYHSNNRRVQLEHNMNYLVILEYYLPKPCRHRVRRNLPMNNGRRHLRPLP